MKHHEYWFKNVQDKEHLQDGKMRVTDPVKWANVQFKKPSIYTEVMNGRHIENCLICSNIVYIDKPFNAVRMLTNGDITTDDTPNGKIQVLDQGYFAICPACYKMYLYGSKLVDKEKYYTENI